MSFVLFALLVSAALGLRAGGAGAFRSPFTIDLELTRTEQHPAGASAVAHCGDKTRAIAHAPSGELLRVRLNVRRTAEPAVEDVLVHFFVVPETALGVEPVPELKPEEVLVEGAESLDFKVDDTAQATFTFRVRKPGAYLVRAESIEPGTVGIGSFAALDLEVK